MEQRNSHHGKRDVDLFPMQSRGTSTATGKLDALTLVQGRGAVMASKRAISLLPAWDWRAAAAESVPIHTAGRGIFEI